MSANASSLPAGETPAPEPALAVTSHAHSNHPSPGPERSPVEYAEPKRNYLVRWLSALAIVGFFTFALIQYPPLVNAGRAVPTPQWALFLGRFHPIAVHMPVGVLFVAAFMELLTLTSRQTARILNPALTLIVALGAIGGIVAVIFGIFLSREGGYESGTFMVHQILGIATAIGAVLCYVFKLIADETNHMRLVYRLTLLVTLGVMSVGAHFGGNLVHGPNYLLEHAPESVRTQVKKSEEYIVSKFAPKPAVPTVAGPGPGSSSSPTPTPADTQPADLSQPTGSPTVYAALVAPLLDQKCNGCHNEDKNKGELRLDTYEFILKGGENGDNVVPGQPDKSLLIARMQLPIDDDEHMPPENKTQTTPEEIALLGWWVKEGARKDLTVAEAKLPAELQPLVQTMLAHSATGGGGSSPPVLLVTAAEAASSVDPAVATAMKKINGSGASLAPVATGLSELRFTALNVAKDYTDANLKDLEPIAGSIVDLDLAKTKVTDAAGAIIGKMTNLRALHLENSSVTDGILPALKPLAKLEYLNVYGTKVTDKVFTEAEALSGLKSLYVWQTAVTPKGAEAFKAKRPGVVVNTGWSEADAAKPVVVAAAAPAPAPAPTAAPAPSPAKPAVIAAAAPVPATPAAKPATPAPAPVAAAPAPAAAGQGADPNAIVFKQVVLPILEAKCVSCHGADKGKGKLRVHTFADVMKGGSDGATTVIPSNVKDSLLLVRALLPVDDDDHMPPSDEPQLTKEEIALLTWWVEQGASETAKIADTKKSAEIEGILKTLKVSAVAAGGHAEPKKPEVPKAKPLTPEEKKAVAEVTAKMTAISATLMPVALDSEQLRFGCVNATDKLGDAEAALLAPAGPHIIWADFARSKVTDAALATVAKMPNLERLHLENTGVTDAGLAQLAGLSKLSYLNLYGTKVTDAGLAKLAGLKSLKKVFVWQTAVTADGAKKLESSIPGLVVNVGLTEAEVAKLIQAATPPPPAAPPKEAPKPAPAKQPEAKPAGAATPPPKPAENKPAGATPSAGAPAPAAAPAPAPAPAPAAGKPAEPKKA